MQHIQNEHPMTSDPAVGSGDLLGGKSVTMQIRLDAGEVISLCKEAALLLKNLSDFRDNVRRRILGELRASRLETTTRTSNRIVRRSGRKESVRCILRLRPSQNLERIVAALRTLDLNGAHKILKRGLPPNEKS
jgi:hypothetical protein